MTEGNDSKINAARPLTESSKGQASALWAAWWPVLRAMLSLLRRHGLRAFVLAGLSSVIVGLGGGVFFTLPYLVTRYSDQYPSWYWILFPVATWLAVAPVGPVESGYWYAMYRLLMGEKVGVGNLFAGFRRLRLYLNLVAIMLVMVAVPQVLCWIWAELPWSFCWEYFENFVTPGSPLDQLIVSIPGIGWFIGKFHYAAQTLILLPIQWSALVVLVEGKSWPKALSGSVRLAWQYKHLVLLMLSVLVVLSCDTWLRALLPHSRDYFEGYSRFVYWLVDWGGLGGHAAITCAIMAIKSAALVTIYQAMRRGGTAQPAEIA
ncbi:MAG: hypothetical protein NTX87_01905 [Planctomycetota bacterium]|nr:hypothetical protein [Planctomycetota bacterium]